jgi:hypothetical protein
MNEQPSIHHVDGWWVSGVDEKETMIISKRWPLDTSVHAIAFYTTLQSIS